MLRPVEEKDAQAIVDIYNYYIEHTAVTFEEETLNVDDMLLRINKIGQVGHIWLVAELNNKVVGYAYSAPWRERSAYRFSCEITVYLSAEAKGKGLGTSLYQALFVQLKNMDIKTVIGGITLPNDASIALHEKLGMEKVAHFTDVGLKFNQWLDVGYWQVNL